MSIVYYEFENRFNDKEVRLGFIRKVYTLLLIQLSITFGWTFYANDGYDMILYRNVSNTTQVAEFMLSSNGITLLYETIFFMFIIIFTIICCPSIGRNPPLNYFFLLLFTICSSYMVSFITLFYTIVSIFLAFGITLFITFILTIYACQTKYDFTDKGGYLLSVLIGVIIFGLLNIFIQSSIIETLISTVSAILFSCYIVYDTQLIVSGNHKYKFDVDEYIFATLTLYLDIINLFINLLKIIGKRDKR